MHAPSASRAAEVSRAASLDPSAASSGWNGATPRSDPCLTLPLKVQKESHPFQLCWLFVSLFFSCLEKQSESRMMTRGCS